MTTASSAWSVSGQDAPLIPLPNRNYGQRMDGQRIDGRRDHARADGNEASRCGTCGQPIGYWAVDRLTGLLDRWGWDTYAPETLRRAHERRQPLALLLLDLDHFKEINDRYGHVAGDMVLNAIAEVLRACCRENDVVGRYGGHGGDEFLVLLPTTNRDRVALYVPARGIEPAMEDLVLEADAALLVAKREGRDTVRMGRPR
jgi:PleD family two-component response regulator